VKGDKAGWLAGWLANQECRTTGSASLQTTRHVRPSRGLKAELKAILTSAWESSGVRAWLLVWSCACGGWVELKVGYIMDDMRSRQKLKGFGPPHRLCER
jgi:hypothetical protein